MTPAPATLDTIAQLRSRMAGMQDGMPRLPLETHPALAGLVLFRGPRPVPGWFAAGVVVVSAASAGLLLWTANLGGQVRHDEIRGAAPQLSAER